VPGHPRPPLPDGPYLVVGLARSGIAAALLLRAQGHEVVGTDTGAPDVERLREAGVEVHLETHGAHLAARTRAVVKSPGVPRQAPAVAAALERGLPVLGELELAWRLIPNDFIAVTGTNGKTTTTELIGHIHREAGLPVAVAGNVGTPLASLPGALPAGATVVAESSSFQLEDAHEFAPDAAVITNLAPDHLDRHGTMDDYVAAKLRVFARQGNDDVAVAPVGLGVEDLGGCARRVCFGETPDVDLSLRAGTLFWDQQPLLRAEEIRLRGPHNLENAMAAAAVTLARGVDPDAVRAGLRTFAGVPHRLEEVADRGGVLWVNDSKATNVASTLVALRSFAGGVHAILGGRGKGQDFAPLASVVAERATAAYLIGEAAPTLREALAGTAVPLHDCGDLARAVAHAAQAARPGEVVLLSPACASFDQFSDFEARGEAFRALVEELA
jgi:UDP-N-acetylmuramoylalanine--D-glutamate ligase